jgi:oligoendopeptidase F
VLDEKGERLLSLAGPVQAAPGAVYEELSTSDIKFPTLTFSDGKEVTLSPGPTPRCWRATPAGRPRQGRRGPPGTPTAPTPPPTPPSTRACSSATGSGPGAQLPTTLDAALDGNNIPRSVVENLVDHARAGTAPLQRYIRLRKKLLGLKEYHPYDGFQPLFRTDKRYPYPEARDLVLQSVAPLGDDYVSRYRRFVAGGRIDVYETRASAAAPTTPACTASAPTCC